MDRRWREAVKLLPRYTIATLAVVVALAAFNIAWLKTTTSGQSAFGFRRDGFDFGVLPMANILAVGLYIVISRRGPARRFLVGFECLGAAALLGYFGCSRLWPDAVRDTASVFFDPVWSALFSWVPQGTPFPYAILYWAMVAATFTAPQLLLAVAGGFLTQWITTRRRHAIATTDASSSSNAADYQPSSDGQSAGRGLRITTSLLLKLA
jgi:hypothetical protein